MIKKLEPDQADLDAFYEAVKDVKRLSSDKTRLSPSTKPIMRPRHKMPDEAEHIQLTESGLYSSVQSEEFISFKQPSVSHKILRKLRKGQYNVDAILDLHGLNVEKAKIAVEAFLQQCRQTKAHVGLIIHGKGHHSTSPVLKNKLNHWLRDLDVVLAFCSAAAGHGSRGAVYVLLKQIVEENDA